MAKGRGKQAEKREASREAILDAAEDLFLSLGFHGARVDDIASRAGLTKGAVYFHFVDKEAVLMEVLHRVRAVVLEPLVEATQSPDLSPEERIIAFLHCQARIANEYPRRMLMIILLSIELNGMNGVPSRYVKGGYARLAVALEKVVSAGQSLGQFRSDLPAREVSGVLLALMDGMMLEWLRRQNRLDGAEMVRAMRAILWAGMVKKSTSQALPRSLTSKIYTPAKV